MKKGEFKITVINGPDKVVSGLLSENFGIHKDSIKGGYSVTRLKTGAKVTDFDRQKDAKAFVKEAENLPGISDMDLSNAQTFRDDLYQIAFKTRGY